MQSDCTILISSCDAYQDILPPFFKLLKKYWPDLSYDIALSTESTDYHDDDLDIINLHPNQPNVTWTERIYDALSKIKTKTVILLCDDFFLYNQVNNHKIQQVVGWLKNDPDIATFTFWPLLYESKPSRYSDFAERQKNARYKVAVVAGAWNKKWLQKYLRNTKESAWQFEPNANKRSRKMLSPGKFFALTDTQDQIFPYNFMSIGLFSGKWLPDTAKLFKDNQIKIDFNERGFYDKRFPSMHKSSQDAFSINSRILPNRYYANNDHSMIKPSRSAHLNNGYFAQSYKINTGKNCIRWIITDQTGFSISNLRIIILYKDKSTEVIPTHLLSGTFLSFNNHKLVFNNGLPIVFIPARHNSQIRGLHITGIINYPPSKKELEESYLQETAACQTNQSIDQNWLEYALSEENNGFIYMQPITTFLRGSDIISQQKNPILLEGHFSYTYQITKRADHISWNPSDKIGFYIKNLKITQIAKDGSQTIIKGPTLSQYLPIQKGNVFCKLSNQILQLDLIKNCRTITISGTMLKPIPSHLMQIATNTKP